MSEEKKAKINRECKACGSREWAELLTCPHCEGEKCTECDAGDDCPCVVCEADES